MIDAKRLSDALSSEVRASQEHGRQASNVAVSVLSDQARRDVRAVIGQQRDILAQLDNRYDAKSTESKIAKVSELVSNHFYSMRDNISVHVDRMAGLLEQLKSMGMTIDDAIAIGILVSSVEVSELQPVTASIKTLSESSVNWDEVTNRLIEEANTLSSGSSCSAWANSTFAACEIYQKTNHRTDQYFLNPMSAN